MSSLLGTTVGLTNMGNTCFLNAALQALLRCTPTGPLLLSDDLHIREESNKREMVHAFRTLMHDFWIVNPPPLTSMQRPSLMPGGFLQSLYTVLRETGDDWHRRGQQSDAAEAIQHILEYLHDALYRRVVMETRGLADTPSQISQIKALESWSTFFAKEYSPIVENFYGQTRIGIKCSVCGNETERFEPYLMLKPGIPGAEVSGGLAPTVTQCMNEEFAPEDIPGYDCLKCAKKTTATKQVLISRLPPVALVAIKRFINVPRTFGGGIETRKVRGKIVWDLDAFDFSPWYAFPRNPFTGRKETGQYTTMSIIEHHGNLNGGHYLMYTRTDDGWLRCDDSSVMRIPQEEVITQDSYIAVMVPSGTRESTTRAFEATVAELRRPAAAGGATVAGTAVAGATVAGAGGATVAGGTAVAAPA